ncbi:MAG: OprD family outer membrane porin, partial [Planctomycetota bacterium]
MSLLNPAAFAAERELDHEPPPSSANEIKTPMERVFEERRVRRPLAEWLREQLEDLPPFFSDTQFEARYRTYYLKQDRTDGSRSEALAMGGSLYYRSGWLAETLQLEVEGFTSQPIVTPRGRDGTLLLEEGQNGYSVLGIANAKLRYAGLVLTGFRQYLDLPYVNRQDNRMTPNTFESITLTRPEGQMRFSTGYSFRIKTRNSDTFESFTKALDLDEDRGLIHAGI